MHKSPATLPSLQELQRVHKQELSSSTAAQARLRLQADQQAAELSAAQAQLADACKQHSATAQEAEQLKAELHLAQHQNQQLAQQQQQVRSSWCSGSTYCTLFYIGYCHRTWLTCCICGLLCQHGQRSRSQFISTFHCLATCYAAAPLQMSAVAGAGVPAAGAAEA
jgi:hypothetical protein